MSSFTAGDPADVATCPGRHGFAGGVTGPFSLGDRFWSAYFYDPNGIRLELATSLAPEELGIVGSARQTEDEARAEFATLFDDEAEIDRWLAAMPLLGEELEIDIPAEG